MSDLLEGLRREAELFTPEVAREQLRDLLHEDQPNWRAIERLARRIEGRAYPNSSGMDQWCNAEMLPEWLDLVGPLRSNIARVLVQRGMVSQLVDRILDPITRAEEIRLRDVKKARKEIAREEVAPTPRATLTVVEYTGPGDDDRVLHRIGLWSHEDMSLICRLGERGLLQTGEGAWCYALDREEDDDE